MALLPQSHNLSPIKLVLKELDSRIQREYTKSENKFFSVPEECLWRSTIYFFFQKLLERM